MAMINFLKRDDDTVGSMAKVNGVSVLQDARVFNTSPISPRKCREILTKLIYLVFTGEQFSPKNATDLFFGISKLFQNPDPSLRQMVYLALKELSPYAQDIIMVTSSIMKDTTGGESLFRPNAVRTLCRVLDAHTVPSIDRLIRAAIVDRNQSVSSAALVSAYHLFPIAKNAVKQWQNETQEAAAGHKANNAFPFGGSGQQAGGSNMSQYHAIGLLYRIRSHDRMALVKMTQMFTPSSTKNPAGLMLMVRLASKLAEDDPNLRKPMTQYILDCLRHKSELVSIEAAKAICNLSDVTDAEIGRVVEVLQLFLSSSPRLSSQFAAIRIVHSIASFKPDAIKPCNPDIEALITSSNRSIATFAITTLLKTGNEGSVDHLMKQISSLITEISDEFRVTIVEAMRTLCLKFPTKHATMLTFLSGILRDEGGYDFKRSIVESMFDLIKYVPDSKEDALAHLCEFIEDCEYTKLAIRVLHLLGVEGPKTSNPTKYIRYIYNRVVLENALVRAAAVTALAKFGVGQKDKELKESVHVLLTRCLDDVDDEVRDRAVLNLNLMAQEDDTAVPFVRHDSMYSLPVLEQQLVMYVTSDKKKAFSAPFDLSAIPVVTREQADAEDRSKKLTPTIPSLKPQPESREAGAAVAASKTREERQTAFLATLQAIKEFAPYGPLVASSAPVELTEPDTEYVVSAVKHIFKSHVVLQFDITNTLPDTLLKDVAVAASPAPVDGDVVLEEDFRLPVPKLATNEPGTAYVAFKRLDDTSPFLSVSFSNVLTFDSHEIDPNTHEPEETGYADEYQVEDLELGGPDYVSPAFTNEFESIWAKHQANAIVETLSLSVDSIADATEQIRKVLSLQPLDGSDIAISTTSHTMTLFGKSITGGEVAAQARFALHQSDLIMKLEVRSQDEDLGQLLVDSVA